MDEDERWRRASEWDDRFSPYRRHRPIFGGLVTALIASISLAIFLSVAGLYIGQFLIATLVTITALMFTGYCFTLLSNHRAKKSFIAEFRRLNKANAGSDHKKAPKNNTLT
jgi:small-conductance mechanosensitive channel